MNYRSLTMDELVSMLIDVTDANKFIEIAKIFVEKFDQYEYISKDDMEAKLEEAHDEGYEKGHAEGYAEGKKEYEII